MLQSYVRIWGIDFIIHPKSARIFQNHKKVLVGQ